MSSPARVLLLWPNRVGMVRLVLLVAALTASRAATNAATVLFLAFFALDYLDGALARWLGQASTFGAYLDVALDNSGRAVLWALACPAPWGALVPCVEWLVFVATHAQASAAWKQAVFASAPSWVAGPMRSGLRNPWGAWVVVGMHGLPLWLWAAPRLVDGPAFWLVLAVLSGGRAYALAIECWVLRRHVAALL